METINLYFSIVYMILIGVSVFLYFRRSKDYSGQINMDNVSFNKLFTIILPLAVTGVGAALILYHYAAVPAGLHHDEASIGYEAYILSKYGLDRDGNVFPIYPITYGSGGGSPLMIYLNVLNTKLFGWGVSTLRLLPAVLGILTLPVFFFALRVLSADSLKRAAHLPSLSYVQGEYLWIPLVSLSVLALCPWHVMLSRWSLDSNTTPFFVSLALFLFAHGAYFQKDASSFDSIGTLFSRKDRKKSRSLRSSDPRATLFFSLSAVMYALCLYSYGSTTVIIPIHLIAISVFCVKTRRMTLPQLMTGVILFILFSVPLMLFYAVNYLGLHEIVTPFFSITRFTAKRSVFSGGGSFAGSIITNFIAMIKNIAYGNSDEQILNYIPGFAPLFSFTFPMTLIGIICSFKRMKDNEILDVFIGSLFIPSFLFGLFVEEDINRMIMVFLPLIYYIARGFVFTLSEIIILEKKSEKNIEKAGYVLCKAIAPALLFVGALLFVKAYFGEYNELSAEAFMPGYGDACSYADSLVSGDSVIYSTYEHVAAPFMVALYYTKTPPKEFISSVHYKDPYAEFRIADSFGSFVFGLPDDTAEKLSSGDCSDIFILHNTQLGSCDISGYEIRTFENFSVLIPD